jgi:hypothetical protein
MRKTPVVLGVLSIIFGSLHAVWGLGMLFMGSLFQRLGELTANLPGQTELHRAQLEASNEWFAQIDWYVKLCGAISLVMSSALVVVGIGLYRRRAWARHATVIWAIVGIAVVVINTIFAFAWLLPHQREIQAAVFARHGVTPEFDIGAGAAQAAVKIFSLLLHSAFPTVLLALIGRRSASRDFLPAS